MSEDRVYGPSGKTVRKPTHREQEERFARAFGIRLEPEPEPEEIGPEADWGVPNRKSALSRYYERNPEKRPKPATREIKKIGQIAPGVDGGEYLVKLLEQMKTVLANYAIFEEKVAALEAKVTSNPDPCIESHGKNFRSVDGECVEVQPGMLDPPAAPIAAKAKDPEVIDRILSKGKFFRKNIVLDRPWEIVSGA